ncbi:MAG: translocation/assembly module TamB domain-containing protein [Flavobacteriia bacterium]|nr:translocation/assembly module TamB domain-containing protein [Flavobacteriia bacterium]
MAKILKIFIFILGSILEWSLICIILLLFAIRSSSFQTYLGKKATDYFSKELNTKIQIKKIDLVFFDQLYLDGVFLLDLQKDTLADIQHIKAHFALKNFDLENNQITVNAVELEKGKVKLYQDKKDGNFNFQFIADYFASEDTTKAEPLQFKINQISVLDLDFKMDDRRVEKIPYGLDYSHLDIKDLCLNTEFVMKKSGTIVAKISNLSLKEQCGLKIERFSTSLLFGEKGLQSKNFILHTPKTKLYFPLLALRVENLDDFSQFTEKVQFDILLNESTISLEDVSYFVPDMEGMDQKITLKTQLKNSINKLELNNFELKTAKNTYLKGSFKLPDFNDLNHSLLNENIKLCYIDFKEIQQIKLPKSSKERYLILPKEVNDLAFINVKDLLLNGKLSDFQIKSDLISSKMGSIEMDYPIHIVHNQKSKSYSFSQDLNAEYTVKLDTFLLGKFIDNKDIGSLTGNFHLKGDFYENGSLNLNEIKAELNNFSYLSYPYSAVEIYNASFVNNVFKGNIDINDKNLEVSYDGFIDLNKKQQFNFKVDIAKAHFDKLHLSDIDTNILKTSFEVNISGNDINNYSGQLFIHDLFYQEGKDAFQVPRLEINLNRSAQMDEIFVNSSIADVILKGKIDVNGISTEINNQFNKIIPTFFTYQIPPKKTKPSKFDYRVTFKNTDDLLSIFVPSLRIAPQSSVSGNFDGNIKEFNLQIASSKINYDDLKIENLQVNQKIDAQRLEATYSITNFQLSDSIGVQNLLFKTIGNNDEMDSELSWNPNSIDETFFSWKTIVNDVNSYFFNINPSHFSLKKHRWDIVDNSQVLLAPDDIQIQNFKIQRDQQFLLIDGCISEQNDDILKVSIKDLELNDFNNLLGLDMNIKGYLNGVATISDPFKDVYFKSDLQIRELFLSDAEIGDINVKANWGKATESIDLSGELFHKKSRTFGFGGSYYLNRKENLNFDLQFDYTDLQFTNAFMDPQVLSNIRGLVEGGIKITGSTEKPEIQGDINLHGGNAKVEMFGVNFGYEGKINIEKDGIFIDNMPIMDEETNTGTLVATVFHNEFSDWNFDISLNLQDDAYNFGHELPRFLVMNTKYKEGDIYYGKAYVTGTANIFGYADNMQISVDMETEKGSQINFPMYGSSELTEDQFINFVSRDTTQQVKKPIDYTGVNMALNFKVTPEAQLKIIFDENLGDEITAYGTGNIAMTMDNIGDLFMNGVFEINKGSVYNFAMGPIKQAFFIEEGGTISWTGDPINAILDLKTYSIVKTTLADIMPSVEEDPVYPVHDVKCYLNLTQSLSEPLISFDIDVPKANENDKAALNRVKGDKDELNKQFFSLLLVKKFQPIQGTLSAGAGAGLDLVSGQINDMLNKISTDVKFNVALSNSDQEKSAALGFQKNLMDDRLILKGSLGVESTSDEQNPSSIIGDVNIEYLINEKGTFRVSVFNESNDNTVIQEKTMGQFTQGAGVNYQEDFNNFRDFQMAQYFLDIFRSQENKRYPIKKKRKRKEIDESAFNPLLKPEE